MRDYSRIGYEVKGRISSFCNRVNKGLSRPQAKFIQQMVYGLISRQSVLLTEIARSLPDRASFKKVHERLSLNLGKLGWKDVLEDNLLEEEKHKIKQDTVIAVDVSEVTKEYARKMEHLCWVRDGSDKEEKLKRGYWLLEAVGVNRKEAERFPLLSRLYSSEAADFISENSMILAGFRKLREAFGKFGIYVFDRAGDRKNILKKILVEGFRFVIRMIGTRNVTVIRGKREKIRNLLRAANSLRCRYETDVWSNKDKRRYHLTFGYLKVKLPFWNKELTVVVVKGMGDKPMMLLTTEAVRHRHELWNIVEIYLSRWGVEEVIRFKKQAFDLENIRLLGYKSLQNMMILVNAAVTVLAYLEKSCLKLSWKLKEFVKHLPQAKEVKLVWYRIIDGISQVMSRAPLSLNHLYQKQKAKHTRQLELPLKSLYTLEVI